MIGGKYMELAAAVQRFAETRGLKSQVEWIPDELGYPFVIETWQEHVDSERACLLVFPPAIPLFTSEIVGFVIKHIQQAEVKGSRPQLLFTEEVLGLVRNVLVASGLDRHADIVVYEFDGSCFQAELPLAPANRDFAMA